jgi:dihydroxyacetone kinase-like protein
MAMKKFLNDPADCAKELTLGLWKAYGNYHRLIDRDILVRTTPKPRGRVPIVFAQGIGHEPGLNGMVGRGMIDVSVGGNIFACAGGDRIFEGIKYAWETGGRTPVLVLIANHAGDVLNGTMAVDMAREEKIAVDSVLLYDDIASAPKGEEHNRRGMVGMMFSFKIAGALAEEGAKIGDIVKKTEKLNALTRTILVALKPATVPATGQALFELGDDEMIIGPGQHGEAGPEGPAKMKKADDLAEDVADRLIEDGGFSKGDDLLLIINGCGGTTLMEMFILYNHLDDYLRAKGMKHYKPLIGNFITTQEMAGFQLTFARADAETKRLWDAPADTPYFKITGA